MKGRISITALFVTVSSLLTEAAVDKDLVTDLPGLTFTPNFKHYSGYLKATGGRQLHYWFVESQNSPKQDPVVLWLNGGPGCSSLDGLLSEHGPFRVSDDGKSINENPYAWNKVANMLYLEAPAGVGYSYSADKNYTTDDDQTSLDNMYAIKYFLANFPEYKQNEFFITGESYGGIYVPTLANRIMMEKDINFKGFAVGNGLSDREMNEDSLVYFGYYHGLYGQDMWHKIIKACCKNGNETDCKFGRSQSLECQELAHKIQMIVVSLNIYNLYAECYHGNQNPIGRQSKYHPSNMYFTPTPARLRTLKTSEAVGLAWSLNVYNLYKECYYGKQNKFGVHSKYHPLNLYLLQTAERANTRKKIASMSKENVTVVPPCINADGATTYLNTVAVRKALHIPDDLPKWTICSDQVTYQQQYSNMRNQYLNILTEKKYRVLVYNGDVDMACNFLGDEWFVNSLQQKEIKAWKSWDYKAKDGSTQVAGFVRQFENLTFLTVKGAGHMVPQDKPIPALKMFTYFIKGTPF